MNQIIFAVTRPNDVDRMKLLMSIDADVDVHTVVRAFEDFLLAQGFHEASISGAFIARAMEPTES